MSAAHGRSIWERCGLTRPWNDPRADIEFTRKTENATLLAGRLDNQLIADFLDKDVFMAHWDPICAGVHEIVLDLEGSISAEHGIGRMKRETLRQVKSEVELGMMRQIKAVFDPKNILNPGKVL